MCPPQESELGPLGSVSSFPLLHSQKSTDGTSFARGELREDGMIPEMGKVLGK